MRPPILRRAKTAASQPTANLEADLRSSTLQWGAFLFPVVLVAVSAFAFWPIVHNAFVNWDDDYNFLRNTDFQSRGWQQLKWAWTTFHWGVYQPLAWLALLVQYRIGKLDSSSYHFASLVLYCAALLISYRLLTALLDITEPHTQGRKRPWVYLYACGSLLLFAVHPLRTEPVAWASCQPYLLCFFFCAASVTEYIGAQADTVGRRRRVRLTASLALFAAALLSKSAAASLPVVLLALDYYPLKRLGWSRNIHAWGRILAEKIPFFFLSIVFSYLAVIAKREGRALEAWHADGIGSRIAQSAYGVWFYVGKTIWPSRLSHFYGRPASLSVLDAQYALCLVAAIAVTAGLFVLRRRYPGVFVAWLCYLIMLAPTLGAVRFGPQAVADRFALLSSVPFAALLAASGLRAHFRLGRLGRLVEIPLAGAVIVVLLMLTRAQCTVWRTSESLWGHALAVGQGGYPEVQNGLGSALKDQGKYDEAAERFREALRLNPNYANAHNNLGIVLQLQHHPAEAMEQFREAAILNPDNDATIHNLAKALVEQGQFNEAAVTFQRLVMLRPRSADARVDLGAVLARLGRRDEAEARYIEALGLKPEHAGAHFNLGLLHLERNEIQEAKKEFSNAAASDPRDPLTLVYLGLIAAHLGELGEAERNYTAALQLAPDNSEAQAQLGAMLVGEGRVLEGSAHLRKALQFEPNNALANFTLAELMVKNGRLAEAREHYLKALAGRPSPQQAAQIQEALQRTRDNSARKEKRQ